MIQPESGSDEILTVGQLRDEIAEQLLTAGIEDYEISARRIVEEATGVGFDPHLLEDKKPVTQRVVSRVDAMSQRRASGEPLQYVIGSWGFRQLDLAVDSRALIPRPETEVVAGFGMGKIPSAYRSCGQHSSRFCQRNTYSNFHIQKYPYFILFKKSCLKNRALRLVPSTGFEPVTYGLEIRCSIQLSYEGIATP